MWSIQTEFWGRRLWDHIRIWRLEVKLERVLKITSCMEGRGLFVVLVLSLIKHRKLKKIKTLKDKSRNQYPCLGNSNTIISKMSFYKHPHPIWTCKFYLTKPWLLFCSSSNLNCAARRSLIEVSFCMIQASILLKCLDRQILSLPFPLKSIFDLYEIEI